MSLPSFCRYAFSFRWDCICTNSSMYLLKACRTIFTLIIVFHSGNCLLFTTGEWREDDGLFDAKWANQSYCNFPIITAVFLMIVSGIEIYRLSRIAMKDEEPSFLSLFLGVLFGITLCAMTVLSAIMITLGFIVWCSDMTLRFPS